MSSRIPVKTPSGNRHASGTTTTTTAPRPPQPIFQTPSVPASKSFRAAPTPRAVQTVKSSHSTKPNATTTSTTTTATQRIVTAPRVPTTPRTISRTRPATQEAPSSIKKQPDAGEPPSTATQRRPASTPARTPKGSLALREHVAQMRRQMKQSAAKPTASTSAGVESTAGAEDPFAHVTDPFNQKKHEHRLPDGIEAAITKARTSGHLDISSLDLDSIPDEVYGMYRPDPKAVIDFSSEAPAWYTYVDLERFVASDNQITIVDNRLVETFGGLTTLTMPRNVLTSLPGGLLELELLSTVDLSGNKLSWEMVELVCKLPALRQADFSQNNLAGEFPQSLTSTALITLDLSRNAIDQVTIRGQRLPNLVRLNVSQNRLAEIEIDGLPALRDLDAHMNCLSRAHLSDLPVLVRLDLGRNALGPDALAGLPRHLDELDLSDNRLHGRDGSQQDTIKEEAFAGMTNLTQLRLARNNLDLLPPGITTLPSLKSIDLAGNHLRHADYKQVQHLQQS
ncbi:hypothetical protein PYCC9005_001555 [Savitreella phatthalungensis]